MKQLTILFTFIICSNFCFSQNLDSLYVSKINDTIVSKILSDKRAFEIQLPRSFTKDDETTYPLMIIMDGDHLFNLVSGSVDYLSYWGDIPENLVVGIKQRDSRFKDSSIFDNINNTPITSTANFFSLNKDYYMSTSSWVKIEFQTNDWAKIDKGISSFGSRKTLNL